MNAELYLKRVNKIDAIIATKKQRYQALVDAAEGLGSFSVSERVQTSKNLHSTEDTILRYVVIEGEINALEEEKNGILATIEKLPTKEYKVLYSFYIAENTLKEIAYDFDRSYEWAKKKKRRGLALLQEILNKRG